MSRRLKQSAARYRIINGARYVNYLCGTATRESVDIYRASGVRCRLLDCGDLLVHEDDLAAADQVQQEGKSDANKRAGG